MAAHVSVEVKASEMPEDDQQRVQYMVEDAFQKNSKFADIAKQLRSELNKQYPEHWHVVVGTDFGCSHEYFEKQFIKLYVGTTCVQAWRIGPE